MAEEGRSGTDPLLPTPRELGAEPERGPEPPDGAVPPRDVVDTVLGFARTLRHAGVSASPDRVEAMLAALGSLDVLDPGNVYWAGRLTLCGGPDDLDRYDAAFAAYFAGERPRAPRSAGRPEVRLAASSPREPGSADGGDDAEAPDLAVQASADEVLRHRDVAELTPAEREHLGGLFALLVPAARGPRRGRTAAAHRHRGPSSRRRRPAGRRAAGGPAAGGASAG